MAVFSRVADEGFHMYHMKHFSDHPASIFDTEGNDVSYIKENIHGCYVYPFDADFIPFVDVLHAQAGREGEKVSERPVSKADRVLTYNLRIKTIDRGHQVWEPITPNGEGSPLDYVLMDAETAYEISMGNLEKVIDAGLDHLDFEMGNAILIEEGRDLREKG